MQALAYRQHADGYYRKNGEPTGEATVIRYAIRPLREMFGETATAEFGPKKLKEVRQRMVDSGLCRNECNRRTRIIVRAFRWAVQEKRARSARWLHSSRPTKPVISPVNQFTSMEDGSQNEADRSQHGSL